MNRPLLATKHQIRKIQTSKTCAKCREPKPLSAFGKHARNKDGLRYDCRACKAIERRDYYSRNKVKIYKINAAYIKANPDKIREWSRNQYHLKNYGRTFTKEEIHLMTNDRYRAARALGFRSGLEVRLVREMEEHRFMMGTDFTYEEKTIRYNQPEESKRYTPDFILRNGIVIEAKGEWKTADRKKITLVKTQFPDLDLRMVFSNADARISKQSKTTYRDICTKLKIPCVSKSVPLAWLQEAPVACRLDALEAACGHTKL